MKSKIQGIIALLRKEKRKTIAPFSVLVIWILVILDINVFRHLKGASVVVECILAIIASMFILEIFEEKSR